MRNLCQAFQTNYAFLDNSSKRGKRLALTIHLKKRGTVKAVTLGFSINLVLPAHI